MLYALANPAALVVLVATFVVGITLMGWASSLVADRVGMRQPRQDGRLLPDPRRHVEPFGVLAAAVSGLGWARPVDLPDRRRRGAAVAVALTGPLLVLTAGVGCLAAWAVLYGPLINVSGIAYLLQHGTNLTVSTALFLAGCSLLFLGALSLVPLPPLPGGMLLFALAPRTKGWQQAEYQLVERNFGILALLVLLLIPLGGSVPMLPALLDIVLSPLVRVICGG